MIAIIDYGVGNIYSLKSSLNFIGEDAVLTADKDVINKCSGIILPGVGAFSDAIGKLRDTGLDKVVCEEAESGKPLLGICLGMQMMFDKSYEYGEHKGLSLIKGNVRPIVSENLKVPHIGWNYLKFPQKSRLFKYINEGDFVYFVHSYFADDCKEDTIALTEYGTMLTAAVSHNNVFATQFHPEKSGKIGLKILKAFCEMRKGEQYDNTTSY